MNVPLRKYRKEFRHSYAPGISATLELLCRQPDAALGVVASAKSARSRRAQAIGALCRRLGMEFRVDDAALRRIGCKENCVVVGVFRKFSCRLDTAASHVVLYRPQYQGNVGTIMRTMAGFGFKDLAVIRPAADVLSPACVRSSMGAAFAVRHRYFESFEEYREAHPRAIHPFVVAGGVSLAEVDFRPPVSLLFGNEGAGLPAALARAGRPVTIPHSADVDSLNVAVAVGIVLYGATPAAHNERR